MSIRTSFSRWVGPKLRHVRPDLLGALLASTLCRREVVKTSVGSFWIDPSTTIGSQLIETGVFEPTTVSAVQNCLSLGKTFIDLGANEGYFSVIASACVGPSGKVIAVEPQRRLEQIILRNLSLNGCTNVTVESVAVGDAPGRRSFYLTPSISTGGSSFWRATKYPLPKATVQVCTLQSLFDSHKLEKCDLLKMDIEGGEYGAIMGSPELFRSHRIAALSLSLHETALSKAGYDAASIVSFLQECGYTQDPDRDWIWTPRS